jgi:DNA primase
MLCELPGTHGALFTWLDSQLHEHGVQPWAALREGMRGWISKRWPSASCRSPNRPGARGRGGAAPGRRRPELTSVLDFMLDDRLKAQQSEAIAAVGKDPKALERYKALETRRLELRAPLIRASVQKLLEICARRYNVGLRNWRN